MSAWSALFAPPSATSNTKRPPADVVLDLEPSDEVSQRRKGSNYLPYRYDIAGVTSIGSQVPLRELEYFRAPWLGHGYDLEIRIGPVGDGFRKRALVRRTASPLAVTYEEHLGNLGCNFRVEMGEPIRVTCAPFLAHSPHVLYTNVIEALLRFLAVRRGRMLLHSACLEIDGTGLLLSARTDTGKTGTILRMLRENRGRFLSDDMTIIAPNGVATTYPKPLTISQHTLRAVQADDLSRREWRRLRLQSRLHSKEGRAFGTLLAEHNLPIMSVNAMIQMLVPPPKYPVDRLVPCEISPSVQVKNLFIIERGTPALSQLTPEETLDELIENTDDAYGFPPFRYFAPALVIGGDDYQALRRRERELLYSALRGMRLFRLASDSFGWADEIPYLLRAASAMPTAAAAPTQRVPADVPPLLSGYAAPVVTQGDGAANGHGNGHSSANGNGNGNGAGHGHAAAPATFAAFPAEPVWPHLPVLPRTGNGNGHGYVNGNGNGNRDHA